jgi:hypothetical protein
MWFIIDWFVAANIARGRLMEDPHEDIASGKDWEIDRQRRSPYRKT